MLSLMWKGERLDRAGGRSRGGWLGGVDRPQPWLSLLWQQDSSPLWAEVKEPARACSLGHQGPVVRSLSGSLKAADLAGPSPRVFSHNSFSLP